MKEVPLLMAKGEIIIHKNNINDTNKMLRELTKKNCVGKIHKFVTNDGSSIIVVPC